MKTLIIDDESSARQTLRTFLNQYCPEITMVGEANSVESGKEKIRSNQPELIFLDIAMQDGTGFDLLQQIPFGSFQLVFTTAYDDYAIKAFEYNAIDYLLKPIHPDQLVRVVEKAKNKVNQQGLVQQLSQLLQQVHTPHEIRKISLATQEGSVVIALEEICHLQSEGSYTTVFYGNCEKVVISKLIKDFEQLLPQPPFFRTHQSHMVNIHCIRKILKEDGGMVLLKSGEKIPVSRRKKEALQQLLAKEIMMI